MDKSLLTVEEAAKRLAIGRTKAYELVASGELQSVTIGQCRTVPVSRPSSGSWPSSAKAAETLTVGQNGERVVRRRLLVSLRTAPNAYDGVGIVSSARTR